MSEVDNLSGVNSTLYTPTTEEVHREYKVRIGTQLPYIPTTEVMRKRHGDEDWKQEQFDRWLAEVKAQERNHIIKLLEAHSLPDCNGDTDESGYCLTCTINLHDAIEIIKGENSE